MAPIYQHGAHGKAAQREQGKAHSAHTCARCPTARRGRDVRSPSAEQDGEAAHVDALEVSAPRLSSRSIWTQKPIPNKKGEQSVFALSETSH